MAGMGGMAGMAGSGGGLGHGNVGAGSGVGGAAPLHGMGSMQGVAGMGFGGRTGTPMGGAGNGARGGAGGVGGVGGGPMQQGSGASTSDVCADSTTTQCAGKAWPNGTVYYAFSSGFADIQAVRAGMDRWEAASSQTVHFVEDATKTAKVTIAACSGNAEAPSYSACSTGCVAPMCGSIDHQLGHILGLGHEQQRNDRDHFLRVHGQCAATPRCANADGTSDLGPFDYHSTMLWPVTDPGLTRFDGSPICAGGAGRVCQLSPQGPGGSPTPGDGSAVAELYSAWNKFTRTLGPPATTGYSVTDQKPFTENLAPGVSLPSTSSPAVETWEGNSLAIYVRGSDDNIYKKYAYASGWTEWMSLGAPSGQGAVSDPAITSWAPGRSDMVVVRGGRVFIMSTPTWNDWQPLPDAPTQIVSGPAITTWGPDRLDVFVRGSDDMVYHLACTADCSGAAGSWGAWESLAGGTIRGKPAPVAHADETIDVFVHGMGDDLWAVSYDGSASTWGRYHRIDATKILKWDASCPDCTSPAAGSHDGITSEVSVRTTEGHVATGSVLGSEWSGYTVLGGITNVSPGSVTQARTSNRSDIVVIMPEEGHSGDVNYTTWSKGRTY